MRYTSYGWCTTHMMAISIPKAHAGCHFFLLTSLLILLIYNVFIDFPCGLPQVWQTPASAQFTHQSNVPVAIPLVLAKETPPPPPSDTDSTPLVQEPPSPRNMPCSSPRGDRCHSNRRGYAVLNIFSSVLVCVRCGLYAGDK